MREIDLETCNNFKVSTLTKRILTIMESEAFSQGEAELLPKQLESEIKKNSERMRAGKPFTVYQKKKVPFNKEVREMYIHEAVQKALEKDSYISREDIEGENPYRATKIKPTNSYGTCLVVIFDEQGKEVSRCRSWNPSAEDLMAKDWIVVKVNEV